MRRIGHIWLQPLRVAGVLLENCIGVERLLLASQADEQFVFCRYDVLHPGVKIGAIHVAEPDGVRAANLVAIAGPDAAERRADVFAAGRLVKQFVLGQMPWKDDVGPVAKQQIPANLDALRRERLDLFEYRRWADDNARRYDI